MTLVVGLLMLAAGIVWITSAVRRWKALNVKIAADKASAARATSTAEAAHDATMAGIEARRAANAAQAETPEALARRLEKVRDYDLNGDAQAAAARTLREATEARLAEISGTPHPG